MKQSVLRLVSFQTRTFVLICASSLLLLGCANTPGGTSQTEGFTAPKAITDVLASWTVPPKFKKEVASSNWVGALDIYKEYSSLLESGAAVEVKQLAERINEQWAPKLVAARERLGLSMQAEGFDPAKWGAALNAGRDTLRDYDATAVLATEGRKSPESAALRRAVAGSETSVAERIDGLFGGYDHKTQPLFFLALPIQIAPERQRESAIKHAGKLKVAAREATAGQGKLLILTYGPLLPIADRSELETAYLSKVFGAKLAALSMMSPAELLEVARARAEIGGTRVRMLKLEHPAGDFPIEVDGKPVERRIAVSQVEAERRIAAAAGELVLLLFDNSPVTVISGLSNARAETERRQVGTRSERNPNYAQAQAELRQLEEELREAERGNERIQREAKGLSGLGGSSSALAIASTISGVSLVIQTTERRNAARSRLAATPQTIDTPIYRNIPIPVATLETLSLGQTAAYLVDTKTGNVQKAVHKTAQRKETTVKGPAASGPSNPTPSSASGVLSIDEVMPQLTKAPSVNLSQLPALVSTDRAAFERNVATQQETANSQSETTRRTVASIEARATSQDQAQAPAAARATNPQTASSSAGGTSRPEPEVGRTVDNVDRCIEVTLFKTVDLGKTNWGPTMNNRCDFDIQFAGCVNMPETDVHGATRSCFRPNSPGTPQSHFTSGLYPTFASPRQTRVSIPGGYYQQDSRPALSGSYTACPVTDNGQKVSMTILFANGVYTSKCQILPLRKTNLPKESGVTTF